MSSHFYLADSNVAMDTACAPLDQVACAGITPLELSTLWAIVEGMEWEVKMMRLFPIVVASSVGERIVHEIPPSMVARLATLSLDEIARVAQGWAATLEMAPRAQDVSAVVVELNRLASRARATDRRLLLASWFARR